jgi:cobyrinic acid a,c-diamide synthase
MALFTKKGYRVQPFKCGPDYIDTKFHEAVCGRPSVNLDTFMATPEHVRELFCHYGANADICVVEGMMGLFDGYDRDKGSSAEVASVLDIPVVLVVDAKSAAYSMAPLLQGFANFRKDVRIMGVIYNKVGSERHFKMLQEVCNDLGIACFGYLPKDAALEQGSRYLGLDFSEEPDSQTLMNLLEAHVNWRALLEQTIPTMGTDFSHRGNRQFPPWELSALIARNAESFSFIYQETIGRFGSVRYFDPENDVSDFSGTGADVTAKLLAAFVRAGQQGVYRY